MALGDFFGSQGFDHTTVKPASANSVLPAGDYLLFSKKAVTKPTKRLDGHYLEIEFDVVGGKHNGRKLWSRMNIDNRNETAVSIAKAELSSLCEAAGVRPLIDEGQLIGVSIIGHVKIDKQGNNVIRSYSKPSAAGSNAAQPAAPPQVPLTQRPVQPAQQAQAYTPQQQVPIQSPNLNAPVARPWERPAFNDDVPF